MPHVRITLLNKTHCEAIVKLNVVVERCVARRRVTFSLHAYSASHFDHAFLARLLKYSIRVLDVEVQIRQRFPVENVHMSTDANVLNSMPDLGAISAEYTQRLYGLAHADRFLGVISRCWAHRENSEIVQYIIGVQPVLDHRIQLSYLVFNEIPLVLVHNFPAQDT